MKVRFDMIGIFVNDIRRMVTFYNEVLGIHTHWDGQGSYAEFNHEGIRFSMFERKLLPDIIGCNLSYPNGINGTFELAIDLPDSIAVDKEYERIVQRGATPIYPPREEPWGMYSSMVADPEGNIIEIGSWRKGQPSEYKMGVVTISVSNMQNSRAFYEDKLGFKVSGYYEPTKWLSYKKEYETLFAIEERIDFQRQDTGDMIDFYLEDIENLWMRIKDNVEVVRELGRTPWGSYKFVIKDPDGYLLGFVKKE